MFRNEPICVLTFTINKISLAWHLSGSFYSDSTSNIILDKTVTLFQRPTLLLFVDTQLFSKNGFELRSRRLESFDLTTNLHHWGTNLPNRDSFNNLTTSRNFTHEPNFFMKAQQRPKHFHNKTFLTKLDEIRVLWKSSDRDQTELQLTINLTK